MSSYARKTISFFVFFYILLMPSSVFNASAENNIKSEDVYTHFKQTSDTSELDTSPIIDNTARTVSHILSSSSSELVDQATSYTLNKFNSTVSSEVQKWLSQYGTVGINFGLNREWTLKNNSIDLLLPIYDNKENWLFFSQLGYRNKDSRNTVNLGLGSRYFDKNWMYGLNTFYDYDVTGNNRRLGLGGEIWADYIKFSANTYHRLSNWQESRNFKDYHERPATGYDINGEFFLSAYPNLGMKLTYEQYFGDNVTLFNRETKQKNPSQTKLDLMYTPIPLITIGASYRQGEGHTETQFLTNLNYKFGIPLSAQLSPNNVASMRTLIGSRHDLVERNNYIILDHKKREKDELYKLDPISGYGQQEITVNAPIRSYANIKDISWSVPDKAFKENDGKLTPESGRSIIITLPSYQETHKSDYELDVLITDNQGRKQTVQTKIKVVPFLIDEKVNITSNDKNGYTFSDPIITYRGAPSGEFVKNASINKVTWITDPPLGDESGLEFTWKNGPAKTNDEGKLADEEGNLILNTLTSKKAHEKVVVYIQLDGAPRQEIGTVVFNQYHVNHITVEPAGSLLANDKDTYTYTAHIVDQGGHAVPEGTTIAGIKWGIDNSSQKLTFVFKDGEEKAGQGGTLIATLRSADIITDIGVSLSVEEQAAPAPADRKVSFQADAAKYRVKAITVDPPTHVQLANDKDIYTYTAHIVDQDGHAVPEGTTIAGIKWEIDNPSKKLTFVFKDGVEKAGQGGTLIATLRSADIITDIGVSLSVEGQAAPAPAERKVSFQADPTKYTVKAITVNPQTNSQLANGQDVYTYTAHIVDQDDHAVLAGTQIANIRWSLDDKDKNNKNLHLRHEDKITGKDGILTATLSSSEVVQNVGVSLAVEEQATQMPAERKVSFQADPTKYTVKAITVNPQTNSQLANGQDVYTYTAHIVDQDDHAVPAGTQIANIRWSLDGKDKNNKNLHFNHEDKITGKDGTLIATLSSSEVVQDVEVSLAVEGQVTPTPAERVSFKAPYTLSLTVDRPTPQPEGQVNKYTFTATVMQNIKGGQPQENMSVTWNTSLPVPLDQEPNLITKKQDATNKYGQATFTMYSSNGGFDDITVTATVDESVEGSVGKKVSITAKFKDADKILLLPYDWDGDRSDKFVKVKKQPLPINLLNFGWNKLKFQIYVDNNVSQNATPYYIQGSQNKIIAHQASTNQEAYFEVIDATHSKLQTRWNFPSSRYLLYQTDVAMNFIAFADTGGLNGNGIGASNYPGRRAPATHCTTGNDVKETDITQNMRNLMNAGSIDLQLAGLLGSTPQMMGINFVGLEGTNTAYIPYTQVYPIKSVSVDGGFIMLCRN
ncbi:inverse autotransporter beta domain-containing protein [Xenorhabdus sp. PB61.4]|uniref:inverse autotransporter beta domain-containing protein n=1 Tax=Xenorhabdus sp. PB61.4 TaxID=2788940 RepID=UPI001E463F04|nr:inverse autotransporter beta domain-containing protein [Xenorhabdus sp. PB61.4]MCC8365546.1 inverse autotransporter beta domain-containing protein [Xenorhabdus sp. PB61.4]